MEVALSRLASAYPQEPVSLWIELSPAGTASYTARIGEHGDKLGDKLGEPIYGWGATPDEAASMAIGCAGTRDPVAIKRKQLQELKDKVYALERELEPEPAQLAELVAQCEKPEPVEEV